MGLAGAMLLATITLSASPAAAERRPVRTQLAQLPPSRAVAPPIVNGVPFLIRFVGTVRGLEPGAAVEVQGIRIGAVRSVGLEYAPDSNSFVVPVVIELQPSLFPAYGPRPGTAEETYTAADALVQRGLRAQLSDTQLLRGDAVVTLDIKADATPAHLGRAGSIPELPAGPTPRELIAERLQPLIDKLANAPIDQLFADIQASAAALKDLVSGPELHGALDELRTASSELRGVVQRFGNHSDALMNNLGETMRSTNRLIDRTGQTLASIDHQVGDRVIGRLIAQVPRAAGTIRDPRALNRIV
jgi:paraquat-inducible protein B